MKIYHNPRCSKSRNTLSIIQEMGNEVEIIEYLNSPPTAKELEVILEMLNIQPIELIRKDEIIWKEKYRGKQMTDDEIINAMRENPKLIERPIVIKNGKAIIGRPPEKVLNLLL
jgi:arsenate reductase